MITKENFKNLLLCLNFTQHNNQFSKQFNHTHLAVDFDKHELIYPEDQGLKIHERQTCNFSAQENFVVFECVHRLLEKGYKPEHIELEPKWQLGHGASGGRADILVTDNDNNALLIIECKTAGKELDRAWDKTRLDGGQLFSYVQQQKSVKFICLYASDFKDEKLSFNHYIITVADIKNEIEKDINKEIKRLFYKDAQDVKQLYHVWKQTYHLDYQQSGLFEADVQAYNIGKQKLTLKDLKLISKSEMKGKYNEFAEILRTHAASGKEGAFDKLINLFLCKIIDEKQSHVTGKELEFYWKGEYFDDYFSLIDRLQKLYKEGMEQYLGEKITYIDNQKIIAGFCYFKQDKNATQDYILSLFKEQKYFTNSDFGFIDVHNDKLFYQNAVILLDIVRMWQHYQLSSEQQHQFLGDMFEFFLDKGFKQSEGQFFTPIPICKFILQSLPLEQIIKANPKSPRVIDYACGSGHFLTEYASQIKPFIQSDNELKKYYQTIFGVEKEYRLSKVAKISAFMYGQDDINVIYCDALNTIQQEISGKIVLAEEESFDILVANPPFAVDGFLTTLPQDKRNDYTLFNKDMDIKTQNNIQCFFIERAAQLLAPKGIAAIIVPSSVLSNSDATHIGSREILLKYFDIVSLVELGSGTFGKTGTNTVVLFLRRKHKRPTEADQYFNRVNDWFTHWQEEFTSGGGAYKDIHFVERYCEHIGVDFEHYQSLLNGEPSADLLAAELFVDYKNNFDKSNDISKLKEQKSFKAKTKQEQQAELDKRLLNYLQTIEKDKLYYFVLAFTNPQKVLVIKSPADNKELKSFLGYGWSDRKGAEGIQLITDSADNHLTPLYDSINRDNPEKISFLIAQNFLGNNINLSGLKDLKGLVTAMPLVELLDFSRKDFNKAILLTAKKSLIIESKWKLVKLGNICEIIAGQSPESEYYNEEKNGLAFYQGKKDFGKIYLNTPVVWTTKITKESIKNDILMSVRAPVGDVNINPFENICIGRGLAAMRSNNLDLQKYLFEFINQNKFLFKGNKGTTFDSISTDDLRQIKIPLPDENTQQQIVIECEAIDKEVENAEQVIINTQIEVKNKIKSIESEKLITLSNSELTIIDGDRGSNYPKKQEFSDTGYCLFLNAGNIIDNKFVFDSCDFIAKENDELLRKGKLTREDIVFTTRGTLGKVAYYHKDIEYEHIRINSGMVIFRNNTKHLDTAYVYEILRSDFVQSQVTDLKTGTSQPQLPIRDINKIKIPVPNIETQKNLVAQIEQLENKIATAQKTINEATDKKQAVLKYYL